MKLQEVRGDNYICRSARPRDLAFVQRALDAEPGWPRGPQVAREPIAATVRQRSQPHSGGSPPAARITAGHADRGGGRRHPGVPPASACPSVTAALDESDEAVEQDHVGVAVPDGLKRRLDRSHTHTRRSLPHAWGRNSGGIILRNRGPMAREKRQRTSAGREVVGIFPATRSLLRLVGAILIEQDDEWAVADRRCFNAKSMRRLTPPATPSARPRSGRAG
jgi:hypothetical protein